MIEKWNVNDIRYFCVKKAGYFSVKGPMKSSPYFCCSYL